MLRANLPQRVRRKVGPKIVICRRYFQYMPDTPIYPSTRSLQSSGETKRTIADAVNNRQLERICKGHYLPMSVETDEVDRLLARASPNGWVGRASAAQLWGLDEFGGFDRATVVAPMSSGARGPGIVRTRTTPELAVHRSRQVTTVAETLVDLGARLRARRRWINDPELISPTDRVELAMESAIRFGLCRIEDMMTAVEQSSPRRPGRSTLEAVLIRRPSDTPATESYLETRMVQLLRAAQLPDPQRQVVILDADGIAVSRVDLLIGTVVIATDGLAFHTDREQFERDRRQWSMLTALGHHVLVFTAPQVERQPRYVESTVRDLLRRHDPRILSQRGRSAPVLLRNAAA